MYPSKGETTFSRVKSWNMRDLKIQMFRLLLWNPNVLFSKTETINYVSFKSVSFNNSELFNNIGKIFSYFSKLITFEKKVNYWNICLLRLEVLKWKDILNVCLWTEFQFSISFSETKHLLFAITIGSCISIIEICLKPIYYTYVYMRVCVCVCAYWDIYRKCYMKNIYD